MCVEPKCAVRMVDMRSSNFRYCWACDLLFSVYAIIAICIYAFSTDANKFEKYVTHQGIIA